MKTFEELVKEEELNDDYIPIVGDLVYRLPFLNSNRVDWTQGVVTKVFSAPPTPEAWITTNSGYEIIEYCNSLYPALNCPPTTND